MNLEPNPNLYPKDGRSFTDLDKTVHTGSTWKEVLEKVRNYRSRNRMPQGNIQREIFDQFCIRNPSLCRPASSPAQIIRHKASTFQNRVLGRLADLIQLKRLNDRPLVDEGEVDRRAKICEKCPKNRKLEINCSSCLESISKAQKILLGKRKLRHTKLGFCGVLDEDLSVTTNMDLEPQAEVDLPGQCWRKKE